MRKAAIGRSLSRPAKRAAQRGDSRGPMKRRPPAKRRSPAASMAICADNRLREAPDHHLPCRDCSGEGLMASAVPWTRARILNNFLGVWRDILQHERIADLCYSEWPHDVRLSNVPPSTQGDRSFSCPAAPPPVDMALVESIRKAWKHAKGDLIPSFEQESAITVNVLAESHFHQPSTGVNLRAPVFYDDLAARTEPAASHVYVEKAQAALSAVASRAEADLGKVSKKRRVLHPAALALPTLQPAILCSEFANYEEHCSPAPFESVKSPPVAKLPASFAPPSSPRRVPIGETAKADGYGAPKAVGLPRHQRSSLHQPLLTSKKGLGDLRNCHVCDGSEKWFRAEFTWDRFVDEINRETFGNATFLALQREIINAALSREDVFAMLPTGGGKSLCYQVTGLLDQGVTLVVMPLMSLMQEQYETLRSLGVGAINLSSANSTSWTDVKHLYDAIEHPTTEEDKVHFVFVTPEKLGSSDSFLELLTRLYDHNRLSRIVVDEAHCVSQWGNDFRPDYTKLKIFRQRFPKVPILALTASATSEIIEDVMSQLGMTNAQVFRRSFNRANLAYTIRERPAGQKVHTSFLEDELVKLIKTRFPNQSGIVYGFSRSVCEETAAVLRAHNLSAEMYHAGMTNSDRERVQRSWMKEDILIIVATIAFGMGINKKDCRFVIHLSMPKSIENYYQESGRAGRDGAASHCIMYFDASDRQKHLWLLKQQSSATHQKPAEQGLLEMLNFCQDRITCRRKLILDHFGEAFDGPCDLPCDNCLADNKSSFTEISCTDEVNVILQLLATLQTSSGSNQFNSRPVGITLLDLRSILIGNKFKKYPMLKHQIEELQCFGYLKDRGFTTDDTHRLINRLITSKILAERTVPLANKGFAVYLGLGPQSFQAARLLPRFEIARRPGSRSALTSSAALKTAATPVCPVNLAGPQAVPQAGPQAGPFPPLPLERILINAPPLSLAAASTCESVSNDLSLQPMGDEDLYTQLLRERDALRDKHKLQSSGSVISLKGLKRIAESRPETLTDVKALHITDFTSDMKLERYGRSFLTCLQRNSQSSQPSDRRERKPSFCSAISDCPVDSFMDLDDLE